jgi:hypothetical protein
LRVLGRHERLHVHVGAPVQLRRRRTTTRECARTSVSVTRSQQDFLATLDDGNGGQTFLYFGSRWGQSPDGLKGHEPQYVFPLQFRDDGSIMHITWNDTVTFGVKTA